MQGNTEISNSEELNTKEPQKPKNKSQSRNLKNCKQEINRENP